MTIIDYNYGNLTMIILFKPNRRIGPIRQEKLDCLYSALCKRYLKQMQVRFILTGHARNVTRSVHHSAKKKEMDARRNVSLNRGAIQRHFMVIIELILLFPVLPKIYFFTMISSALIDWSVYIWQVCE